MNAQNSTYATNYGRAVQDLLDARDRLKSLREQDGAAKVKAGTSIVESMTGPTLGVDQFGQSIPGDLAGANDHLAPEDFTTAFAAMDALEMVLTDFSTIPPTPTQHLGALTKFRR